MSDACLSEARSTARRAKRSASALSGVEAESGASSDRLSMPATIALRGPSLRVEFVNSSDGLMAGLLEGQQGRRGV